MYKFSSHQLLLMYTEDARKKGYTIEMTLSSTMLKEMAFRLHVGLRVKWADSYKKHYDDNNTTAPIK